MCRYIVEQLSPSSISQIFHLSTETLSWLSDWTHTYTPTHLEWKWYRIEICVCSKLPESCLTLCNPMADSPPGFSVHWILPERILECVAMPSSRGSSQPRDWTSVSWTAGRFFTAEPPGKLSWVTTDTSSKCKAQNKRNNFLKDASAKVETLFGKFLYCLKWISN